MSLARMRTINESLALIKEADPDSAITYNFIRKLVREDKVRYFLSGKKIILNFDDLMGILTNTKEGINGYDQKATT